jgi:DNA-binding transcriptional LysR family regulator
MDTQHIRFVRSVAERGNISAAARELGITQPALTKIVSRIEDLLGTRLFDRMPRGVALTPFGELVLSRLDKVEHEMLSLSNEIRAMKAGLSGTVSIGVGQFWLGRIVPNVVAKLMQTSPDIQTKIVTGNRDELLESLLRGKIDLVLGRITEDLPEGVVGEALGDVRLFLTVREGHPLASLKRPVRPEDLRSYSWVLPPSSDPTAIHINRAFNDLGFSPGPVAVEALSQNLIAGLLQTTDMITAMPEITVSTFAEGLRRLNADWLEWSSKAGVISVKDRSVLPCTTHFLELLRQEMVSPRRAHASRDGGATPSSWQRGGTSPDGPAGAAKAASPKRPA